MIKFLNISKQFFFFIILMHFNFSHAEISSKIVAKVGNFIITNHDVSNEIKTTIFLSQQALNQKNINAVKQVAINTLVGRLVKKNEIKKYKIDSYSKAQLTNHTKNISNTFGVKPSQLKELFSKNGISYKKFIESTEIDLKWMSLIYKVYKRQVSVNPIEIENILKDLVQNSDEVIEFKLSEIEITRNNENYQALTDKIYSEIRNKSFVSAVKKFSISETSKNNGSLGWVAKSSLNQQFLSELNKVKKGDFTLPIKNENSIVILKIDDTKTKKKDIDLENMKNRLIEKKKGRKIRFIFSVAFSKC